MILNGCPDLPLEPPARTPEQEKANKLLAEIDRIKGAIRSHDREIDELIDERNELEDDFKEVKIKLSEMGYFL